MQLFQSNFFPFYQKYCLLLEQQQSVAICRSENPSEQRMRDVKYYVAGTQFLFDIMERVKNELINKRKSNGNPAPDVGSDRPSFPFNSNR